MKVWNVKPLMWIIAALAAGSPFACAQNNQSPDKDGRIALEPFVFEKPWGKPAAEIEKVFKNSGFDWLSADKSQARVPGYNLKLEKKRIGEMLLRFEGGKFSGAHLIVYSRGDHGDLPKERFEWAVDWLADMISAKSGIEPGQVDRTTKSATKHYKQTWIPSAEGETAYKMEWSDREDRRYYSAEFIKLTVAPYEKKSLLEEVASRELTRASKADLKLNVEEKEGGDVWIPNIPMVDQGDKGYCAVATVDRVMKYYGLAVDQHEMAQIADASAWGGTDPEVMVEAIRKISGRLKVRMRVHEEWDYNGFVRDLKGYAREADRRNESGAGKPVWTIDVNSRKKIYFSSSCYPQMDGETFKSYKTTQQSYDRFLRDVKEHINEGIPILWGCQLGMFKEPKIPQIGGGHMRLIIGYNEEKKEIIFSDSWGIEHAAKRLNWENAYTMTTGYSTLEPSR
ncbi:MAG: C39 family peptidase [Verrucomicrobiales bacterium]